MHPNKTTIAIIEKVIAKKYKFEKDYNENIKFQRYTNIHKQIRYVANN